MPLPLPKPRHTIEKSESLIRVILPGKKNAFYILWTSLWLFLWGYMVFAFSYIAVMLRKALELAGTSASPVETKSPFIIISMFLLVFFLVFLAMGAFGIYRFIWLLAGKEVIEANAMRLKITRQSPVGKSVKEYVAGEVKDLRVSVEPSWLSPFKRWQRLLNQNGMIAFDYGAKTFRFGAEIDEAEAKQIILALQERLPQQNAG